MSCYLRHLGDILAAAGRQEGIHLREAGAGVDGVQGVVPAGGVGYESLVGAGQAGHVAQQCQVQEGKIAGDDEGKIRGAGLEAALKAGEGAEAGRGVGNETGGEAEAPVTPGAVHRDDDPAAEMRDALNYGLEEGRAAQTEQGLIDAQAPALSSGEYDGVQGLHQRPSVAALTPGSEKRTAGSPVIGRATSNRSRRSRSCNHKSNGAVARCLSGTVTTRRGVFPHIRRSLHGR